MALLPLPTKTSCAPFFSIAFFSRCNCTACSRQNIQPKWRRNTRTVVLSCHSSCSSWTPPSRSTTVAWAASVATFMEGILSPGGPSRLADEKGRAPVRLARLQPHPGVGAQELVDGLGAAAELVVVV